MLANQTAGCIQAPHHNGIHIRVFQLAQNGGEVLVIAHECLRNQIYACAFRGGGSQIIAAHAVVVVGVEQAQLIDTEVFLRIGDQHLDLQFIALAGSADPFASGVGQQGRGCARNQQRDPILVGYLHHRQRAAAAICADNCGYLILDDQLRRSRGGLCGLCRIVLNDQLQFAAQNTAFGVDLLNSQLHAVPEVFTKNGLSARQRDNDADLDGFAGKFCAGIPGGRCIRFFASASGEAGHCHDQYQGQRQSRYKFLHGSILHFFILGH